MCFSKDGFLFIAEQNRVLVFPAAEFFYESPDVAAVPRGEAGRADSAGGRIFNHTARVCRDRAGQQALHHARPALQCAAHEKVDSTRRSASAASSAWTATARIARSLRRASAIRSAWISTRGQELWFTDNQVDGMGDDIPPGELNRATSRPALRLPVVRRRQDAHQRVQGRDAAGRRVFPPVEMVAHAADLGMMFYTGNACSRRNTSGGIFSAQHGSWNRTDAGRRARDVHGLKEDGTAGQDGSRSPRAG